MFEEIILDHQEIAEGILSDESIIPRDVPRGYFLRFLSSPNILSILGVRRCGKTVLSLQLLRNKNFVYVNFDDERLLGITAKDLNELLKAIYKVKDPEFIVFDEIQNVEGWELFLNRLRYSKKIIITGSNSRLLSSELSTHLTGRRFDFTLFPFSFKEHLKMKGVEVREFLSTRERGAILRELEDYLFYGGFPERYRFGIEFVRTICSDIVSKDVARREKVRKVEELERFVHFLISNASNELSVKNIKNILGLHVYTLQRWLRSVENTFLLFFVEKFSTKLKVSKKIYLVDNGVFSSSGYRLSEGRGRLMENLVAIELLRRKSYWHSNWEIYYFKDYQQHEVDFLIKEGLRVKQLIQVTYANSFDEIDKREIRALLHAGNLFKSHKPELIIITWDYEDERTISWFNKSAKIKFIPLWKWLPPHS